MRKFYAYIAISIITFSSACSETTIKTDLETRNLKDSVSSIIMLSYDAIDRFGEGIVTKGELRPIIEESIFDTSGKLLFESDYFVKKNTPSMFEEFDSKGYRTNMIIFDDYGKPKYTHAYVNDEKGNIVHYTDEDGDVTRYSYVFDGRGRIIKKTEKHPYWQYSEMYIYDDKGNCIEEKTTLANATTFNTYDDQNKLIGYKHISDPEYSYEVEITYDDLDRRVEQNKYSLTNPQQRKLASKKRVQYYGSSKLYKIHQEWNEKGEIKKNSSYYYTMFNDTIPEITITKDKSGLFSYLTLDSFHDNQTTVKETRSYDLQCEKWTSYSYKYTEGKLSSITNEITTNNQTFIYANDKLKKSKQTIGDSCYIITEYNRAKLPVKEIKYDNNNQEIQVTTYDYSRDYANGNGTCEFVVKDKKQNQEITGKNIYKNGLLIEISQQKDGINMASNMEYDEHKNIIKRMTDGKVTEYRYKFDRHGNWIEQLVITDGKPERINVRMIQYFQD